MQPPQTRMRMKMECRHGWWNARHGWPGMGGGMPGMGGGNSSGGQPAASMATKMKGTVDGSSTCERAATQHEGRHDKHHFNGWHGRRQNSDSVHSHPQIRRFIRTRAALTWTLLVQARAMFMPGVFSVSALTCY